MTDLEGCIINIRDYIHGIGNKIIVQTMFVVPFLWDCHVLHGVLEEPKKVPERN